MQLERVGGDVEAGGVCGIEVVRLCSPKAACAPRS